MRFKKIASQQNIEAERFGVLRVHTALLAFE
jgi:hypothetical protein